MLKNIFVYYLSIVAPILALIYLAREINSTVFVSCLFAYVFVYRPAVDRLRLIHKGTITRQKALRFYFPGIYHYYFKELYLP